MSFGPINGLSSLQSIFTSALQKSGVSTNNSTASSTGIDPASAQQPDNSQLSPFAQLMSELQQLQQSDPAQYQQVTQQISTNLQSAAQTAQANGNTTAANKLDQLASDFSSASQNGQLPNVQDLAKAVGGHRHHHAHAAPADSNASSTDPSSTDASPLSQLLAALQTNSSQSDAVNPESIILNTLSSAGIGASNS